MNSKSLSISDLSCVELRRKLEDARLGVKIKAMNRKAIVLTAGVLIAACALVLRPTFVTRGYSQDGAYADCTYYPSHKEMFLSNDAHREREVGRISLRLKKFPAVTVKAAQMQPRNFIDWAILTKMNYDGVTPASMSTD